MVSGGWLTGPLLEMMLLSAIRLSHIIVTCIHQYSNDIVLQQNKCIVTMIVVLMVANIYYQFVIIHTLDFLETFEY